MPMAVLRLSSLKRRGRYRQYIAASEEGTEPGPALDQKMSGRENCPGVDGPTKHVLRKVFEV